MNDKLSINGNENIQIYEVNGNLNITQEFNIIRMDSSFNDDINCSYNSNDRKKKYRAIHAKAHDLGMDISTLYNFINTIIKSEIPIISIKKLTDIQLKKIYVELFTNKNLKNYEKKF